MPTTVCRFHPTPLYEALAAFATAALLWRVRRRWQPSTMVAVYLILAGTARFLVEIVRINTKAWLGLTQPQLWSLALVAVGAAVLLLPWQRWSPTRTVDQPLATGPSR